MNLIERYLNKKEMLERNRNLLEDSNIKADYIIYGDYSEFKDLKNISELKQHFPKETRNYNFGDLIALSQYRDSDTYIISKNGKLIRNPMINNSGYLTIPYEITQYLDDACKKYEDIEPSELYLRYDDKYIKDNIGDVDPSWNFQYILFNDETLSVTFPENPNSSEINNINHHIFNVRESNSEYIYQYYLNSIKEQDKIRVKYKLENEDYDRFIDKYGDIFKKPSVHELYWNGELGSCGCGSKSSNAIIYYKGPACNKNEVIYKIHHFFDGFQYEII